MGGSSFSLCPPRSYSASAGFIGSISLPIGRSRHFAVNGEFVHEPVIAVAMQIDVSDGQRGALRKPDGARAYW